MICRECGREMKYITSFGNNYDEPREDLYRCKCGVEVWVDYCSETWSNEQEITDEQIKEMYDKLLEDGKLGLSDYDDPYNIQERINKLGEKAKLKTNLERDYILKVVEVYEEDEE